MTTILIIIGAVIATPFIIALFLPKKFIITAEIDIHQSNQDVFNYVVLLKNQHHYSKWVMQDPNAKMTYTNEDGKVGFIMRWESENKNVGIGEQEIISITPNVGYRAELRFEKPFKATNYAETKITPLSDNTVKIATTFEAKTAYPMNLMTSLMCGMLKKDMDQNNKNLKAVLEQQN